MASDDELKDEELVDFEGSDYELGFDYEELEEVEEEEDAADPQPFDLQQAELHRRSATETLGNSFNGASETLKGSTCGAAETLKDAVNAGSVTPEVSENPKRSTNGASEALRTSETLKSADAPKGSTNGSSGIRKASESPKHATIGASAQGQATRNEDVRSNSKEGTESGEIEEERDEKEDIAVLQPAFSLHLDDGGGHCTSEHMEGRFRKHSKPDLEDGELDETAMPQSYGSDAEEEIKDDIVERERKRRKDAFMMERQVDDFEGGDAKEVEETGVPAAMQHHSSGSDKAKEHLAGLSSADDAGGRGLNMRTMGLGQGSLAPGIMGPGRPLIPLGIGSLVQGFGPFGGIAPHGRPHVHLQEVLAQEHLLRAHALHMAQESLASAIRSPMTRPLGASALQPFLGFDILGPRSHAPKHFPPPPPLRPDLILGPMENFVRGQRPNLAAGRTGVPGKAGGQTESSSNSGIGRQFGWPTASMLGELQHSKRGRARGRGLRTGLWGDAEPLGPMLGGLGSAGISFNPGAMLSVGAAASIRHLTTDEVVFYQTGLAASQTERNYVNNEFDARWKIEKERMLRNGLPHFGVAEHDIMAGKFSDCSREFGKDIVRKMGEAKPSASQDSSRPGSLAARLGPPSQAKFTASSNVATPNLAAGSNVIHLHQPVRKSRILTVSGLPEDTPMSTVVEVFEKLGKITDFKKGQKGDTFTISYSNEIEAVTAKRNLHRSFLAGRQITVDYAHQ